MHVLLAGTIAAPNAAFVESTETKGLEKKLRSTPRPTELALYASMHITPCLSDETRYRLRPISNMRDRTTRSNIYILSPSIIFAVIAFLSAVTGATAEPLRIVAVGASNTQGWYVGKQGAYPAKLQALLKAQGIDAQVINAGVPLDTTANMLKRIDSDVPAGTDIVILQPGANDRRFLVTKEQRAANIATMEHLLRDRSIKVIVYDEDIPIRYYTFDFIHLTGEGHAMIAASLLPRIMAIIHKGH